MLGEKDLEIAILRDLLKKQPSIKDKVEIAHKWIEMGYAATKVFKIVKLGRSTYYYNISNDKKKIKNLRK